MKRIRLTFRDGELTVWWIKRNGDAHGFILWPLRLENR